MPERIPEEGWRDDHVHVDRYKRAAAEILPGETVLDVACGIGYGAEVMHADHYIGVDRPGVVSETFAHLGRFIEADLEEWEPDEDFDVAVCFETLEHVPTPARLAGLISAAKRLVIVSVPTVPTVGRNEWHLHDFRWEEVPSLFPTLTLRETIPQPEAASHIYTFLR